MAVLSRGQITISNLIDGKISYTHQAWADGIVNGIGSVGFSLTDSIGKKYTGFYSDFNEQASTDPTKYSWVETSNAIEQKIAYAWSPDGTDRFTRTFRENLAKGQSKVNGVGVFDSQYFRKKGNVSGSRWTTGRAYMPSYTTTDAWSAYCVKKESMEGMSNGDTFYFSAFVWNNGDSNITMGFYCVGVTGQGTSFSVPPKQWYRLEIVSTINDFDIIDGLRFESPVDVPNGIYVSDIVLKKDDKDKTVRLPSDADCDNAVPHYIGRSLKDSNSPTDYKWEPYSGFTEVKTSTSIDQTNKAIILKADQTTVNEITGRVSTAEGKITLLSDRMNFRITNSDGSITQIDLANKVISLSGEQVNITGNTYIANGVIKTATIADLAVNTSKIANLSVSEGKIANLAVSNAKIASLAVDEGKIANLAVSTAKIGNLAVSEGKIADLAVTNAKIANLAVSTAKIADLAVTNAKIGSISADKINVGTLNAADVNIINLNASNITTGTISGTNLSINLSTGVVNFQKGVIQKTDGKFLIDVTKGIIESYQSSGGFTLNSGNIELRDSSMFNSNSGIYGKISWSLGILSATGLCLEGKNGWQLTKIGSQRNVLSRHTGSGVYGNTGLGIFAQDIVEISGGYLGEGLFNSQPHILIGCAYNNISQVGADTDIYGNYVQIRSKKGTLIDGNLSVTGSKNAIHKVGNDWIATPAYETAESYLGDIGSSQTNESGEVTINMEYLFNQIVNTNMEYQVFVSSYGEGHVWVEQRYPLFFVVKSSKPNTPFAFEIKAKRKGYEFDRLVKQAA